MLRLALFSLLGLLLTACVTPSGPVNKHSHKAWQQRLQQLEELEQWQIRGRVAVFVDNEVYNLGLSWQRDGADSNMNFEASLGQGFIQLNKNSNGVELETSEGTHYEGSNAQQVIYRATGLTIPVEGLQSWTKGIPHTHSTFEHEIDADGRAAHIVQDGWFINYLDYEAVQLPTFGEIDLPRKLYMKHDRLALKVVIDQWRNQGAPADAELFPDFPAR
jgi:outer membrane lipoprotein LolB